MDPNQNSTQPNNNGQLPDPVQPNETPPIQPQTPQPTAVNPPTSNNTFGQVITPVSPSLTSDSQNTSKPFDFGTQQNSLPSSPATNSNITVGIIQEDPKVKAGDIADLNPKKRFKKPRVLILSGVVLIVLLLSGGVVFGLYLPNKPENVYKTGLSQTGETLDKLVTEYTEEEKLTALKNTQVDGSLEITGSNTKYTGSFSSKYDEQQSDSSLTYNEGPDGNFDFAVQVLTDLAEKQVYPDIYFKITGLSTFDSFIPGLAEYDGKWISVTADYLKSVIPTEEQNTKPDEQINNQDVAELSRVVMAKTREYVFSSDPDKAVLVLKEFIATEDLDDGVTANHYKVGINKENAKKYCKALVEGVVSTSAYTKLPGVSDDVEKDKASGIKACEEDVVKDIKDDDTFDLWVDKKLKLIHKIRFTEKDDDTIYAEIGQNYKGGNQIPMFVNYHNAKDSTDVKITLDLDVDKNITKLNLDATTGEKEKFLIKGSLEFKPHEGDIKIQKPVNAVPVEQILQLIGY